MNWQRIAAIVAILSSLAGGGWWFVNNVVFASDFNRFQQEEQIRWLMYDEDRLWREYQELQRMDNRNPVVKQRKADLEFRMRRVREQIRVLRAK